jgi:hypothetical protein
MFKNLKILRPILVILILFIPLYPKFPLIGVSDTYVAIRLDDIIVAFAILVWFIYQIKHKFPVFKLKITKLFIFYFLAIIASAITAFFVYKTTLPNILLLNLFRRFEYISLFFITVSAIKEKNDLKCPYVSLIIATLLVCIYGYGQKYFSFPVISTMNAEFSKGHLLQMNFWTRISSTFAGHYDLATFLSVALVLIGCFILLSKNKLLKFLTLIVWIVGFQILTFTASRISTFAFWGGICLALFLIKKYLWIIPVSILVILSIVSSGDLNQRLLATIPALQKQLISYKKPISTIIPTQIPTPITTIILSPTPISKITTKPTPTVVRHQIVEEVIPADVDAGVARSGEIRFNVEWPRAINAFRKNIITGTGLGSITLATDNDYLRLLGESGLLGFISFMSIFAYFIAKTFPTIFKKKRNLLDNFNLVFLAGLITFFANATFIDVFEASKTAYLFWIMMGIYYQCLKFAQEK